MEAIYVVDDCCIVGDVALPYIQKAPIIATMPPMRASIPTTRGNTSTAMRGAESRITPRRMFKIPRTRDD
jgi:hypothetical protein